MGDADQESAEAFRSAGPEYSKNKRTGSAGRQD